MAQGHELCTQVMSVSTMAATFDSLDRDCLTNVLRFVRPCCMRRVSCVDKCMRNAVVDERARRITLFPAGATKRTSINASTGCNMLCSSPDGSCFVGAGSTACSREATVYDNQLLVKGLLQANSTRVFSVATDGKHHVTGHLNGNIQIWHAATLTFTCGLQHGRSPVLGLAVRGDVLISGSKESTAKRWSIASCTCCSTLQHQPHKTVNSVDVDEASIATASDDQTCRLWTHSSDDSIHVLHHAAEVTAVSLASEVVATGCCDNNVRVFAVDSGQLLRTLRGHCCEVLAVYATDGVVVSGACDKTVRVWLMEEEAVAVLEGHSTSVQGVALGPGGGLVASLSDCEMLTWRAPTFSPAWRACGCHGKCQCPKGQGTSAHTPIVAPCVARN